MEYDKSNNLTIFLLEIADCIRELKGIEDPINPQDFVSLIRSLSGGTTPDIPDTPDEPTLGIIGTISDSNIITLLKSLTNEGTYVLRYEDASHTPLNNFSDICTLVVTNTDAYYREFISVNIPPYMAEYIGVYNESNESVGYIDLTGFKVEFGERLYRFGVLSDVHDYDTSDAFPSEDFNEALSVFNDKEDVVFTCICGDITQDGTEAEFIKYQNDVATYSPNTPVYTTTGNHDAQDGINNTTWRNYTGELPTFEKSYTASNGKTDHFLFLGMHKWDFEDAYPIADLDWLESKLEEYKNERCFVFTHLFFPDRAGNLGRIYPYYNWLSGSQLTRLQSLNDRYINSVWFSGHSHWKWYLQKYESNENVYRTYSEMRRPECGWCVHIPSCASPIDSDYSSTGTSTSLAPTFSTTARVSKPLESEGAIIDVYENYVDLRGIVFKGTGDTDYVDKYIPIATYRLDTTIHEVGLSDRIMEIDINNVYLSGSNEGNPTYYWDGDDLVFEFDAVANRLMYTSSEFTSNVTRVALFHEGVEYSQELDEVTLTKVGFQTAYNIDSATGEHTTSYSFDSGSVFTYAIDDTGSINDGVYSIQCNVSSSYEGPLPLTVRLKNPHFVVETSAVDDGEDDSTQTSQYIQAKHFHSPSSSSVTVVDSTDENYVDVTFTSKGQKIYIKTDDFPGANVNCTITIEDSKVTQGGRVTTSTSRFGFNRNGSYTFGSTTVTTTSNGIELGTASNYNGSTPLVIHMKVKVEYVSTMTVSQTYSLRG